MKVALVHDDLTQWGGAERVLAAMHEIWPQAPIFTVTASPALVREKLPKARVVESFVKRFPFGRRSGRLYFFLHPVAFETFDFTDFDLVVSSTSRFAKGILTKPGTLHLAYCHTPIRFLWRFETTTPHDYLGYLEKPLRPFLKLLKSWDQVAASRPDAWITNSNWVAKRIANIYQKTAHVIYPFVDDARFISPVKGPKNYLLVVSRLVRWKKIHLAIDAAKRANMDLIIVGSGPDKGRLKSLGGGRLRFLSGISDSEVSRLMANCFALLVCHEEDFGMVAVEVQAAGRPVVAYRNSGTAESIVEGQTGVFFDKQTTQAVVGAIRKLQTLDIDPASCQRNAQRFTKEKFKKGLLEFSQMSYNINHKNHV